MKKTSMGGFGITRPPIIISNGGVITKLAHKLEKCATQDEVENRLKKNVEHLLKDGKTETEIVLIKNAGRNAPFLFWRLKSSEDDQEGEKYKDTLKKYRFNVDDPDLDGKEGKDIRDAIPARELV